MAAGHTSKEMQIIEEPQTPPKHRTEEDVVEELILDYACKSNMQKVISEVFINREDTWYQTLYIPHLRFIASTMYSIIHEEHTDNYEKALRHLNILHDAKPDLMSAKRFVKLTAGIKAKIILTKLESKFDYAIVCAKLNQFFPKAELHAKGVSQEQGKLNNYQLGLRRQLTRLIVSPSERQAYHDSIETHELGKALTESVQDLVEVYCARLNENLKVPVIEQIVSEGPQSQISRDVENSPMSCMDHLLSICFKGPPSEEQLLHLLTLTKEERSRATADIAENFEVLSSSSSDEAGERGSSETRGTKHRTMSAPSQRTHHHDLHRGSPQNENSRSTRLNKLKKNNVTSISKHVRTKQRTSRKSHNTSSEEELDEHELVPTPSHTSRRATPKSKIYFSTALKTLSQPQPSPQISNMLQTKDSQRKTLEQSRKSKHDTGPTAVPCGTPLNANSDSTKQVKVITSQCNSESSGNSSSQSTTSVSLLPSSKKTNLISGMTQENKITDVLVGEEDEQPSVEYTGSVIVIEETPSGDEIVEIDNQAAEQCNRVSSSGSSSAPSQSSQKKEVTNANNSNELQDSSVSSVFDSSSIIYPSLEAVESTNIYTFIRTPLRTTPCATSDSPSVLSLPSDSDENEDSSSSVVSDSEESFCTDEDVSSEVYFTPREEPLHRRIPTLSEYLTSPAIPSSSTDVVTDEDVLVIRPCVVVLYKMQIEEAESTSFIRRSNRLRQKAH